MNTPRRAALSPNQIKQFNDLADRLEFWGKTNKSASRWTWLKMRDLGIEQANTANEIRSILNGERS